MPKNPAPAPELEDDDEEEEHPVAMGEHTHLAAPNGPACGKKPVPTHAALYVSADGPKEPTCPWCLKYVKALRKQRHPSALAPAAPPAAAPSK